MFNKKLFSHKFYLLVILCIIVTSFSSFMRVSGESENSFITKSQFAYALHQELGINIAYLIAPDITEIFDDVKNSDYYALPLYDLVVLGIIDDKEKFAPNEKLPREQLIHYIINAFKKKVAANYQLPNIEPQPFIDISDVNETYINDIKTAQKLDLITGDINNKFYPKNNAKTNFSAETIKKLISKVNEINTPIEIKPFAELRDGKLTMKLTITNNTTKDITINHTSGQKYDFEILDINRNVLYRWSADKSFIQMLNETVIPAGKSIEFCDTLTPSQVYSFNRHPIFMYAYLVGDSEAIDINPEKPYVAGIKRIYN